MPVGRTVKKLCLFCGIAAKPSAVRVVYEDSRCIAFLDHRPLFMGHVLLIPKKHYETLTDLPAELTGTVFLNVRRLAAAVEKGLGAHGTFIAMNNRVSQSVPHAHVHIVPRKFKDGLRGFFWPRTRLSAEQMNEAREKIISALEQAELPE